jgi:membrane-bound lytic murein transglycosylase A
MPDWRWYCDRGRFVASALISSMILHGCTAGLRQTAPKKATAPSVRYELTEWSQLEGWDADSLEQTWPAFIASCSVLGTRGDWAAPCDLAQRQTIRDASDARVFFENYFAPYRVVDGNGHGPADSSGLITGYYEPLLRGARSPSAEFSVPLYAPPEDLLTIDLGELYPSLKGQRIRGRLQGKGVVAYFDRAGLEGNSSVKGKEIVWVNDPIDAFFLEIQGSGRVELPTGEVIRVAYADQNGHPYRPIGRYLVEHGELALEDASAQHIRAWLRSHPQRLQEVLHSNPSVVFFREEPIVDASQGPKGSLGVPLTAGRSIAIDASLHPLGAPFFLSTQYPGSTTPLQRLVVAQDTGGAIRGPVRADFFWGFGAAAAENAGSMRQTGRLWLLWPKEATPPGVQNHH